MSDVLARAVLSCLILVKSHFAQGYQVLDIVAKTVMCCRMISPLRRKKRSAERINGLLNRKPLTAEPTLPFARCGPPLESSSCQSWQRNGGKRAEVKVSSTVLSVRSLCKLGFAKALFSAQLEDHRQVCLSKAQKYAVDMNSHPSLKSAVQQHPMWNCSV